MSIEGNPPFFAPNPEQIDRLSTSNWCVSYSGGKDSTSVARGQQFREAQAEIERLRLERNEHKNLQAKQEKEGHCGLCGLCGLPMRPGEAMFKFHGFSESCEEAKIRIEGAR